MRMIATKIQSNEIAGIIAGYAAFLKRKASSIDNRLGNLFYPHVPTKHDEKQMVHVHRIRRIIMNPGVGSVANFAAEYFEPNYYTLGYFNTLPDSEIEFQAYQSVKKYSHMPDAETYARKMTDEKDKISNETLALYRTFNTSGVDILWDIFNQSNKHEVGCSFRLYVNKTFGRKAPGMFKREMLGSYLMRRCGAPENCFGCVEWPEPWQTFAKAAELMRLNPKEWNEHENQIDRSDAGACSDGKSGQIRTAFAFV